ncbi:Malic enzyme [Rhynchospora pubera]|uniref:Malic enzyme n=1 Tax=Rhynchospora pubera TaxID=906938 RepID=A0AAV8F8U9_9POAL|nr:Malic enzyme [Rhynchospora pubera]
MFRKNIQKYLPSLTKELSFPSHSPFYSLPSLLLPSFQVHWSASHCSQLKEQPHTSEKDRSQLAATDARRCEKEERRLRRESEGKATQSVAMESFMKGIRGDAPCVLDMDPTHTVGGGVEDFYGEDHATEDQLVTPWTISVASGHTLLRDKRHNKGLAFTETERDAHYLRGLLPPALSSQELQERKMMKNLRSYEVPLQRYQAMMDLQERNERLFYKILIDNVEELLPVVYTPTVGEACQKYGSIFKRPQGLYISLKEKGKILEVLRNWPERSIQVIVVTDGERILGLGDLGCQGMGIPVGKLSLYTALGGVRPSACLPITLDVGTNNETLLNDEFYIGLKQKRIRGQEYADFLQEFMSAVKQSYGEKVLIQFEDFANHNAFELLAKYGTTHLVFNDDIQGTASVVLAGLLAALKLVSGALADHTFLFLGAGEAGTGIAELIALEISRQTKAPLEETRKKLWLVDSKGLVVSSRNESLQHFKKPWAHEHEPLKTLLEAVQAIKPTVLIGTSGVGQTFTQEVVEAMASFNEKPLILALSNPTSQAECTAEQAYTWSKGKAIFASGSPFDPFEYEGKTFVPGQANNAYIFPGFGLGVIMCGAIRVHDDMLLAASEALAKQVSEENYANGLIYPPFTNIRKISANIAASVAAKAYELGLASRRPRPDDLVKYAESCMYTPVYRNYR